MCNVTFIKGRENLNDEIVRANLTAILIVESEPHAHTHTKLVFGSAIKCEKHRDHLNRGIKKNKNINNKTGAD